MRTHNHLTNPLPIRDGVSASRVWLPQGNWAFILDFLVEKFPNISPQAMQGRMQQGDIMDSDGNCYYPDSPYRSDIHLFYYRELHNETKIPFEATILYQDEHIVVADKPHFLPVVPSGRFLHQTLLVRLKKQLQLDELTPIHRIDRETAGIVMFCINPNSRGRYQSLFQQRKVSKRYQAIAMYNQWIQQQPLPLTHRSKMVKGEPFFRMKEEAGKANSETTIDVIEHNDDLALYDLKPITGKQHQLRVHLASLGCPILHDPFYPDLLPCKGDDFSQPLQLLAKSIAFIDPITHKQRYFKSQRQLNWKNNTFATFKM
jgi:tRNA pseudouridine32 synthase/23S rRNA pseudouridine746 synthase